MADTDTVGWVTLAEARSAWSDAPKTEPRLRALLATAYEMCAAYAPALAEGVPVPSRYKEAQVLHARAIYTAYKASVPEGMLGLDEGGGFASAAPTLGGQIKQLLRPPTGLPVAT